MSAPTPDQPISCVVIQLARLGDTLQTLMALRAAKQLYPQLEIHMVVRERFSAAVKRVSWIKSVHTLPTETLLGPIIDGTGKKGAAIQKLARWLIPLVQERWDFVVNWSYSDASSYLTGLLPAKVKLGYSRRTDMAMSAVDGWSHYIQAVVQGGCQQNIHLTDIFTTQLLTALQIHHGEPQGDMESSVTSKDFFTSGTIVDRPNEHWAGYNPNRKWLAIQLGASQEQKTWPVSHWAQLITEILTRHPEMGVVLLGDHHDKALAIEMQKALPHFFYEQERIQSLIGETTFDLWIEVIKRCHWLFSGDTAAIHLASLLGTRVLNLSLGGVRFQDTGPYGNGHYIVACQVPCEPCALGIPGKHSCRIDLTPEAVYGVWDYASHEWMHRQKKPIDETFEKLGFIDHLNRIAVYRSKIRPAKDGGGVTYEALLPRPLHLQDWQSMMMGHIARTWYCGWVPEIENELKKQILAPTLLQRLRKIEECTLVLRKICEEAKRSAVHIYNVTSHLKSDAIMDLETKQFLNEQSQKLAELDKLMEDVAKQEPTLQVFIHMAKVLMHNLRGTRIYEIARDTELSYGQLIEGLKMLESWTQRSFNLSRPALIAEGGVILPFSRTSPAQPAYQKPVDPSDSPQD